MFKTVACLPHSDWKKSSWGGQSEALEGNEKGKAPELFEGNATHSKTCIINYVYNRINIYINPNSLLKPWDQTYIPQYRKHKWNAMPMQNQNLWAPGHQDLFASWLGLPALMQRWGAWTLHTWSALNIHKDLDVFTTAGSAGTEWNQYKSCNILWYGHEIFLLELEASTST